MPVSILFTTGVVCPSWDCGRAFRDDDALAAHVQREHAKVRTIYGCTRCCRYYADEDDAAGCCAPEE